MTFSKDIMSGRNNQYRREEGREKRNTERVAHEGVTIRLTSSRSLDTLPLVHCLVVPEAKFQEND
jgi:hypothetical protein